MLYKIFLLPKKKNEISIFQFEKSNFNIDLIPNYPVSLIIQNDLILFIDFNIKKEPVSFAPKITLSELYCLNGRFLVKHLENDFLQIQKI